MRLAILSSHPVQYYAPLIREVSKSIDTHTYFAHDPSPEQQAAAGFGTAFKWDIDVTSGYSHSFLNNVADNPSTSQFSGCDTPEIGQVIKAGQYDVVLTLGWHLKSLLQGIWAAKRQGIPVMIRGDSQLGTPRGRLKTLGKSVAYPLFLRQFNAALYVGSRNRAYYEHYGVPSERLFHSPHCVETERFGASATQAAREEVRTRIGVSPDTKLVLFAGKLIDFKRPIDAVHAVAKSRETGIDSHLMIAGAGPLEEALTSAATDVGVPLHLLGFQNQTQMPAAYAAADALVLPSTGRETWGLVCNEALACGTPIVVSDAVGCSPDLASDGAVGRQFPLGNIAEFAAELSDILRNPPSAGAIKAVSDRHSLSAAATGIVQAARYCCESQAKA